MRRRDLIKLMSAAPLALGQRRRYEATWDSIDSRAIPAWYSDAKFGIFIHWGVYSVPAFAPVNVKGEMAYAEWYWHSLTEGKKAQRPDSDGFSTWAFHKRCYGADFPYFNFAPMFRAELFDPDQWADLFVRSGARYVAQTSKHHEGFTLWRSEEANRSWGRPWNSVDIGPKRDLIADMCEAGRAKGLQMGIYYSLYEWYNPLWLSDRRRYVTEHMIPQFKDVVKHVKPSIIFSDGEWEMTSAEWHATELLAWLFNESPVAGEVVIEDRWGKETRHKHGGYYTTEYTSGMQQSGHAWEESRGMAFSYGYNRIETLRDYRSARELTLMLLDIVSRGGNLLLDIGPTADGRIPVIMQERLVQLGDWLKPNGEAIYGTRVFSRPRQWSEGMVPKFEEKDFGTEYDIKRMVDAPPAGNARVDVFFTSKNDIVYAILPRWPAGMIVLNDFAAPSGAKITLLETGNELHWRTEGSRLQIDIPDSLRSKLGYRDAYVLRMAGVKTT